MNPKELRNTIKTLAADITETKKSMKAFQKENKGWGGEAQKALPKLQWDYRHKHIAASLLRGTPYERIESPAIDNEPNWDLIKEIQNACTPHVCAHAE
jgi:hypothetical protein